MNQLPPHATKDRCSHIKLRAKDQEAWIPQREMAELFDVSTDKVGQHLRNYFENCDLSHTKMERATTARYLDFDQSRKQKDARLADMQDDAELESLVNILKKRPKS